MNSVIHSRDKEGYVSGRHAVSQYKIPLAWFYLTNTAPLSSRKNILGEFTLWFVPLQTQQWLRLRA